jgi:1-acyl-sn-glycerol-3-phosphate acyltransferase
MRAIRRALLLLAWTFLMMPAQTFLNALPGDGKRVLPRIYWRGVLRLFGLRRRVIGAPITRAPGGRSVLFVANHASWLDIPLLGAECRAVFVSKDDVRNWPVINLIAHLGRTVFISRERRHTARGRAHIAMRLKAGDNLILFPEGTTSDGSRVLPFRSAFLAAAMGDDPPLIQPVSIAYDRLAALSCRRAGRALFAYYGATSIGAHFWRIAQWPGLRATLMFHAPLDPRSMPDRKALSQNLWQIVAAGAAALRQGRDLSRD